MPEVLLEHSFSIVGLGTTRKAVRKVSCKDDNESPSVLSQDQRFLSIPLPDLLNRLDIKYGTQLRISAIKISRDCGN